MNIEHACPPDSELLALLDGHLSDPGLSVLAEHLEHCLQCQAKADKFSSNGALSVALLGDAVAFNRIANQTPPQMVQRIKQIPILDGQHSGAHDLDGSLSRSSAESVGFSADSTLGGLGRLGDYRILKLLGSGGMGSVFLAEESKLNRHVALKVMLPKFAADPVAKQRFLREARSAASLKSDHIVTVHQVGEENEVPYLAMELLVGSSLDEVIRSRAALSGDEIVHIGLGIAKGLADAHEKGMIHRDIKPGNIWVEPAEDGLPRVKILDFGLARLDVDDMHLTHASAIVGTPAFMAPEQARGDNSVDARADLFSLGCVLYYLCTSEVPFKAESMLGTLMALAANTPVAPADRNQAISLRLSRLIMKLLEKAPSHRPQSAREVATELKDVKRELQTGIAQYASPDSAKFVEPAQATAIRNGRWTGVTVAVALITLIGLAWLATNKNGAPAVRNTERVALAGGNADKLEVDLKAAKDEQAQRQFTAFSDSFHAGNPKFLGALRPTIDDGEIVGLTVSGKYVSNLDAVSSLKSLRSLSVEGGSTWDLAQVDVSGIEELPLQVFGLFGGYVVEKLDSLKGLPLTDLELDYSPVSDLTPLAGMPLQKLTLWNWTGSDLTPLRGLPIVHLNIGGNGLPMDLSPLADSPLSFLCINVSGVSDLSPLKGLPLRSLYCSNTQVSDLSPIQDSQIEELMVRGTRVNDLAMIKDLPLRWLEFEYDLPNWHAILKDMRTLQRINDQRADTVIAEFDPKNRTIREADFVNSLGMEFVIVSAGKTLRGVGNFDEFLGKREIEITNEFYLGRYEVTQDEWVKLMGVNPSYFGREGPGADKVKALSDADLSRLPVERVSWLDCQVFLEKLNQAESDKEWQYRLPTEAEWTYACQGGPMPADFNPQHAFYFDKPTKTLLSYKANTKMAGFERPCKVGVYAPNSLGLFDMHGNVFEWCEDLANLPDKRARWIHGGGWRDVPEKCQSSTVLEPTEPWTYFDLGFRVARVKRG